MPAIKFWCTPQFMKRGEAEIDFEILLIKEIQWRMGEFKYV